MTWAKERLDGLVARQVEPPPVVETLKLGLVDAWGEGWARKRWEPAPDLLNGDGSLFGGYLAALADQMAAFAAMSVLPDRSTFRTTNLQMQFFRIGAAQPLDLEGRVVAQTKRLISVEVDFRRPDRALIARGAAQQAVIAPLQDAVVM
jgi:uncharacterized protein (TIGR00369 family)